MWNDMSIIGWFTTQLYSTIFNYTLPIYHNYHIPTMSQKFVGMYWIMVMYKTGTSGHIRSHQVTSGCLATQRPLSRSGRCGKSSPRKARNLQKENCDILRNPEALGISWLRMDVNPQLTNFNSNPLHDLEILYDMLWYYHGIPLINPELTLIYGI